MTKIAAQCYTVREFMQNSDDVFHSFKRLSDDGWKAVQLSGGAKLHPAFIKAMAGECGLTIAATHINPTDLMENTDEVIAEHKTLECNYVGIGGLPPKYARDSAKGFEEFAKDARPVAKKLADAGLTMIYHNHSFEFTRFGEVTGMDILMAEGPKEMMFELDTYWAQYAGVDVQSMIKKLEDRIDVIHFKDMKFDPALGAPNYAEIGQGNMNWKKIINACSKAGVRWHIVEQDTCPGNPFDSLKISLDYLKKMGLR